MTNNTKKYSPSFEAAYQNTMAIEIGYANDPSDKGKETFNGISRGAHPDWKGWRIIDEQKKNQTHLNKLTYNKELQQLTKEFYKVEFWDKLNLCQIPYFYIVKEIFDTSVNVGKKEGVVILQKSLNILNRNNHLYPDIKVDGIMGPVTIKTLKTSVSIHNYKLVYNVLNIYQGRLYLKIMESDPTQEKFIGWFKRIRIIEL